MQLSLLIADDDKVLTGQLQQFMTRHGYHVETAGDGLECLKRLRQAPPHLLVLNLHLPWGGGDGVLAWLREEARHQPFPAVLLIGDRALDHHAPLLAPPVARYLPRPFSLRDLLRALQTVHDRVRQHQPPTEATWPRRQARNSLASD